MCVEFRLFCARIPLSIVHYGALDFDLPWAQVQLLSDEVDELPHCEGAIDRELEVFWLTIPRQIALHSDIFNRVIWLINIVVGPDAGRTRLLRITQRVDQHDHRVLDKFSFLRGRIRAIGG